MKILKDKYGIGKNIKIVDSNRFKDEIFNHTYPESKPAVTFRALKLHEVMLEKLWRRSTQKDNPIDDGQEPAIYKNVCLLTISHTVLVDRISRIHACIHEPLATSKPTKTTPISVK